jgi:hypothetical protein
MPAATKQKKVKGAPRSKRQGANNSPARQRYWGGKVLEKHKVKALMQHNGMTRAEAYVFWVAARGGRRMRTSYVASEFIELPKPSKRH